MYIKWIVCNVPKSKKIAFSNAQQNWLAIKNCRGFVAQLGGWNIENKNEACIISFWENKESLQLFMENKHDELYKHSKQANTYTSCEIKYFTVHLETEGSNNSSSNLYDSIKYLKITDCTIIPEQTEHFNNNLKSSYNLGLKNSFGMLGGKFAISDKNENNYLLTTFLDNENNNMENDNSILSNLHKKFEVNVDIVKTNDWSILLENRWKVIHL